MSSSKTTSNPRKRTRTVTETAASSRPKRAARRDDTLLDASTTQPISKNKKAETNSQGANQSINGASSAKKKIVPDASVKNARSEGTKSQKQELVQDDGEDVSKGGRSYWLMKAEPEPRIEKGVDVSFSIDDLRNAAEPEPWDGVRNSVARNNMRSMKKGDLAFFYHSSCKEPGIVGTMEIVQEHSVDETAFDPANPYYDEKIYHDNYRWVVVHVKFRSKFKEPVKLSMLKSNAAPGGALEGLQTVRQSRLSVSAVTPQQWNFIMSLAEEEDTHTE
ncbi:hypothetical protein FQN57_007027 [Myotisia sp. PD_48]|nr:hypothetical protein FQN57_007027 [Myotisia sp. PD_48]